MHYTTIYHPVRKQFGLSCNEYCVADMIELLAGPNSTVPGWCIASRGYLAEELDTSRQTIITILKTLTACGIVVEDPATKYLRPTDGWKQAVERCKETLQGGVKKLDTLSRNLTPQTPEGVKKLDTPCQETLQDGCKETLQQGVKKLDTDNKIDNKRIDNKIDSSSANASQNGATLEKKEPVASLETLPAQPAPSPPVAPAPRSPAKPPDATLREQCLAYHAENPDKYKPAMYKAFLDYWTAPIQNGKKSELGKELWKVQKTWNLAGRLANWHSRDEQRKQPNGNQRTHQSNQPAASYEFDLERELAKRAGRHPDSEGITEGTFELVE